MCLPACTAQLALSRRSFLRNLGVATCAAAAAPLTTRVAAAEPELPRYSFQRVIDLTHTLSPSFPMPWKDPLVLEQSSTLEKDGFNALRWHLHEHIGTHIDAPLHFSHLESGDRIPAEQLVGPLVIVDIRARAAVNSDAELTLDDVKAWEQQHGRIPDGAIVALNSGWDVRANDRRKFFGFDAEGSYHLPGFHLEAVQFLHEERIVKGIATDTINLDRAVAKDFPVHHYWLGHNKWGLECIAGLSQLPPKGVTVVVGGPKIAGCTGGPSRVLALL